MSSGADWSRATIAGDSVQLSLPAPRHKDPNGTHESDSGMSDASPEPAQSLSSPENRETTSTPPPEPQKKLPGPQEDSDSHQSVIIKPNRRNSERNDVPLDFSLKPKKPPPSLNLEENKPDNRDLTPSTNGSGRSAFEAVSPHTPSALSGYPSLPNMPLGSLGSGLNPAFLTGTLPIGSPLLSSFNGQGLNSVLENGSNLTNRQQGRTSPPAKVTRPFKAYNPTDPLSALHLSSQLSGYPPTGLPPPPPSLSSTDNFLAQYRQYLLNAQAALLLARTHGSANPPPQSNVASVIAQALNGQKPQSLSGSSSQGSLTPSPPQVTSTSHPHYDEIPPHAGIRLKSAKSVDLGNIIRLNQSQEKQNSVTNQPLKSERPTKQEEDPNGVAAAARRRGQSLPDELKDQAYWERRRKNNEAAKRSRDTRRQKEDEIAMRAAVLEQENLRLRLEVQQLKAETEKLRQILLNN